MIGSDSEDELPLLSRVPAGKDPPVTHSEKASGEGRLKHNIGSGISAPSATVNIANGSNPTGAKPAEKLEAGTQMKNNIVPSAGFSRDKLTKSGSAPATKPAAEAQKQQMTTSKNAIASGKGPRADTDKQHGKAEASRKESGQSAAVNGRRAASNSEQPAPNRQSAKPASAQMEKPSDGPGMVNGSRKRPLDSDSDSVICSVGGKRLIPKTVGKGGTGSSKKEDDVPLTKRMAKIATPVKKPQPKLQSKPKAKPKVKAKDGAAAAKEAPKKRKPAEDDTEPPPKRKRAESKEKDEGKDAKWTTLSHSGVLFPPEYVAHGVKMNYDGRPVDLTAEQEEVASMYAIMLETDYLKKDKFNENFWKAFKDILGSSHVIKTLEKCDFRPIYDHLMAERDQKKALPKEQKVALKEEKDRAEAKYKVALVDNRREGVGNFRVEPPGLFRGRGEHPKMGQLKRRIYPRDITINIGKGEEVPEHPYPGQKWKEIRHDNTVTWLAFWKDPISTKDFKYVWLAANSVFKSDSDLAKYEKARKLKDYVDDIRDKYTKDWASKDLFKQQMGIALYFIDKLALRAGHEKDEDEADTVGCCTLKVENVECMEEPANHIKFDFLGKDSIRYENQVEVDPRVWELVQQFCSKTGSGKAKKPDAQVFETMNATDLNNALKERMDGLSVKVFRTYNASITLDRLLYKDSVSETVEEKKADYDRANKEVAILCNHQRSVPKGHGDQMQRLADKLQTAQDELDDLTLQLKIAQGKAKAADAKKLKSPEKKIANEDVIEGRIKKKKEQLSRLQVQSRSKEDLKTVALGTSKINYLDPRITVAWCKRQEVPIEKIFNKSLITKFHWAMDVEPEFSF